MAEASRQGRTVRGGQIEPSDDPDMVIDIRVVDGIDGQRLRAQQTQVIREVITWLAQNSSGSGQRPAA